MNVIFTRRKERTRLICRRLDGTSASADLGPSLPGHDLAHLIVERTLQLRAGFFVSVAKGYSIQQLSHAAIVRSLGTDPYVAEILARALGALATGGCTADQFANLVSIELRQMGLGVPRGLSAESAKHMLEELRSMIKRFGELALGESMELQFDEAL